LHDHNQLVDVLGTRRYAMRRPFMHKHLQAIESSLSIGRAGEERQI